MKITENHLSPSNTIVEILENIDNLEKETEIDINVLDFVSIDESYMEGGSVSLDVNDKNLSAVLREIRGEVEDKQNRAIGLLRQIVATNFEEKLELFQLFEEVDPQLEFPVSEWFSHPQFKMGISYIKAFDLNLSRYSLDSFKVNQKSILKYILKSENLNNEVKQLTMGASKGFDVLDDCFNSIKDYTWLVYDVEAKKKLKKSFAEMITQERGFPVKELQRYLLLKEFSNNPFHLDSPELLKLSNIFKEPIPNMFLNEVKRMDSFSYKHFFLIDNSTQGESIKFDRAKIIIEESLISHFLNIKEKFKDYAESNDCLNNIKEITKILCNQLEKTTKEKVSIEERNAIAEKVTLEMMIPMKDKESPKITMKF